MKRSERGFTLIELLLVTAIVSILALASGAAVTQLFASTKRTNDHMTAVRQVQNAGFWISRDAMMSDNAAVDNQTPASFLVLTWTEWGYDEDSTYHSVTYSLQELSGGIGKLERQYLIHDDEGAEIGNTTTLIAEYIYFDPGESDTTEATYTSPVLTVQITSSFGEAGEIREYEILLRRDV